MVAAAAEDYYYTLRDVIFFLENSDISVADYRRKSFEAKVLAVVEQDKKSLKDYLAGVIDTCPQIDLAAAAAYTASIASAPAQALDQNKTDSSASSNISQEQLQELRQRHAAILDQSIQRTSVATAGQAKR